MLRVVMNWATNYIEQLKTGRTVTFRPRGHSMAPKVNDGDRVTVEPLGEDTELAVGDIVLCTVRGSQYLHLIKALSPGRAQIGNNRGRINGWIGRAGIHGRCVDVERSPAPGRVAKDA